MVSVLQVEHSPDIFGSPENSQGCVDSESEKSWDVRDHIISPQSANHELAHHFPQNRTPDKRHATGVTPHISPQKRKPPHDSLPQVNKDPVCRC